MMIHRHANSSSNSEPDTTTTTTASPKSTKAEAEASSNSLELFDEFASFLQTKQTEIIDEIEELGGMTEAIISGMPKMRIGESAARR